jgi:fatty aldehyde-generating acyl-ACP reductase
LLCEKGSIVEAEAKGRVAFIGHPADMDLYRAYIRFLKPDKTYDDRLLIKLFEWAPSYKVTEWHDLTFDNTTFFDAVLIMVPFLPEMRDIRLKKVVDKIDQALTIAAENECSVAALGAFTSIVLQGQEQNYAKKHRIVLTSGNTFTASVIVRSVEEISRRLGVDLSAAAVAVIGASGDIGSGCVSYLHDKVSKMVLTARSAGSLDTLLKDRQLKCAIEVTTDNKAAVNQADIVIFVTSAYVPMFSQDDFRPGSIVCDASAPLNVSLSDPLREDVFIYHGGIVSMPFTIDPGFDLGLASTDTFYGCQVEGILMALDKSLPYSWGRGNITSEKMNRFIGKLDTTPNLSVSFSAGKHVYTDEELKQYRMTFRELIKEKELEKIL